ncbi:MAG TPA: TetR/AcrR family transcriptional regulator [Candidatus Limnocylindrales bacterium]|nr:TetR/AcrR family transcriptional regulator [Candidatus Limnocylindrales bacterium]
MSDQTVRARPAVKKSEQRRQELVEAAFHQIAERGFEGLRTRDVAAEVGVNIATLHYYFPTKEALIGGVLELAMDKFRSTLAPHGSPSDQLRNHLRSVRKLMGDDPELGVVMGELALRAARDRSIAKIYDATRDAWQTVMRGLLRRGVREGNLRAELDSDAVATLVIAVLTALTLPPLRDTAQGDVALRQLERWLGISGRKKGIKQLIDGFGNV